MILFNAPSDTVVNGTLNSPSGPSTKTATTGLFKSFCHINVPDSRSSVTVRPLPLPVKCKYPIKRTFSNMSNEIHQMTAPALVFSRVICHTYHIHLKLLEPYYVTNSQKM